MSTENVEVFNKYQGNGVATQFSIGFPYLKREYVKVYLYRKATGEEVKLNSNQFSFVNDQTIIFPILSADDVLQEGDILTIQRETTLGSEFEFDNQRRLFPVEVMNADDLAFQQIQELSREIKRAVRVNPTAAQQPEELLTEVYDKLDSATEVAEQAIGAASQATTAAKDAKDAVVVAQQQITETQAFVEQARTDINKTVEESIDYVEQEAVKAATEVVGTIVGQYTDRAETAARNAEADAIRAADSASQASTSASEAEAIAGEVSAYNFKNKITNCITEIPQDIKLELKDGTLTLKAGSKTRKATGVNSFVDVNITSDSAIVNRWGSASSGMVFYGLGGSYNYYPFERIHSGATNPTGLSGNSHVNYNTTDGYFYHTTTAGSTWTKSTSGCLPLACVTWGADNKITSIDQVFNGFGYIGSAVYALPGVKCLTPSGRNADGSLKNVEFVNDKVRVSMNYGISRDWFVFYHDGTFNRVSSTALRFDVDKNKFINIADGSGRTLCICGTTTGDIDTFSPKLPFRAVDYNDLAPVKDTILTKQDIATAVNYDNITNCITEIPQDIKLELNNGTLTLKAGSKVYVPNGAGKFDEVIYSSDISVKGYETGVRQLFVFIKKAGGGLDTTRVASSGSDSSSVNGMFYNTATNTIDYYNNGIPRGGQYALPLGIITMTDSTITSIDQVFNGFGYIGSTVFALPGVKGLIPNGRNADGTLKNIEFTTSKVLTVTASNGAQHIRLEANRMQTGDLIYNETENINTNNGEQRAFAIVGTVTVDSNKVVTSLDIKLPFRAVDYNEHKLDLTNKANTDLSNVDSNIDYVVESYADDNGKWYRIYKSGWIEQGGLVTITNNSNATITLLKAMANTNYTTTIGQMWEDTNAFYKNQGAIVSKSTTSIVLTNRRFLGEASYSLTIDWEVKGYMA